MTHGNQGSTFTRLFKHGGYDLTRQSKIARLKSIQRRADCTDQSLLLRRDQNARQTGIRETVGSCM